MELEGGRKEGRSTSSLSQRSESSIRGSEEGRSVGEEREEEDIWNEQELSVLDVEGRNEVTEEKAGQRRGSGDSDSSGEGTLTRSRSKTVSVLSDAQPLSPQSKSAKKAKKKRRRSTSVGRHNSVKLKEQPLGPSVDSEEAARIAEEDLWLTWSTLMKTWEESSKKSHKLIKQLVRQGIPEHLRGMAWQLLADAHDEKLKDMYPALITVGGCVSHWCWQRAQSAYKCRPPIGQTRPGF